MAVLPFASLLLSGASVNACPEMCDVAVDVKVAAGLPALPDVSCCSAFSQMSMSRPCGQPPRSHS